MARKSKKIKSPIRSSEVPVTSNMMWEMEDRLNHKMNSGFHNLKSEIQGFRSEMHGMKSEMHGIKSDIHGIKSDIHGIKSDLHGMKSDIHSIKSELHRVALLVEEQNARNKYVMDGYAQVYEMLIANKAGPQT